MPKTSSKKPFSDLKRVSQKNLYYCGPAVLEILFSYWGVSTDQDDFVRAANVAHKIKTHGMTLAEMATATRMVDPEYEFWLKRDSSLSELSNLVNKRSMPVGVEWQGIFDDEEWDEEDDDDDPGHYSVVTGISTSENYIFLSDPYKNYTGGRDRRLSILEFERRWWDINEVIDPVSMRRREIDDYHAMFIIVPRKETFPKEFGMERG